MIENIIGDVVAILIIFFVIALFEIFAPSIDYHYYSGENIIFTHISLYDYWKNKHPKGYKGFVGGDIAGQLNYLHK
jgi:hypothetical protein